MNWLKTPALKLPTGLVNWPKSGSSKTGKHLVGSSASSSGALAHGPVDEACGGMASIAAASLQDPVVCLQKLCSGGIPLLSALQGTCNSLSEVVEELSHTSATEVESSKVTESVNDAFAPLSAVVGLLSVFEAPERHLELALTLHTNKQVSRGICGHLEEAVKSLYAGAGAESKESALRLLRSELAALQEASCTIWELHLYFTFVDVKGDKALVRVCLEQISRAIGCSSAVTLSRSLAATGPWVREGLEALSEQAHRNVLERRHTAALKGWREQIEANGKRLPAARMMWVQEAKHSDNFWEAYFSGLLHITWVDFAEAFTDFYALGSCPVDVLAQLRLRVCGSISEHRVRKQQWQMIPETIGKEKGGEAVLSMLLEDTLGSLDTLIYRAEPLKLKLPEPLPQDLSEASEKSIASASTGASENSATDSSSTGSKRSNGPSKGLAEAPETHIPGPGQPPRTGAVEEGHSTRATPVDPRVNVAPVEHGPRIAWPEYVLKLASKRKQWYHLPQSEDGLTAEQLHAKAACQVAGSQSVSTKACVLRVVTGDLAKNLPCIQLPSQQQEIVAGGAREEPLPALVVSTTSHTHTSDISKFGRGCTRRSIQPDHQMHETIASRSHFNVAYDQDRDQYCLHDAGSKWGTFLKVAERQPIVCGDWLRIGNAEMVVRYCGGTSVCRRVHRHYKLHSLQVQEELRIGRMSLNRMPPAGIENEDEEIPMGAQQREEVLGNASTWSNSCFPSFKPTPWPASSYQLSRASGLQHAGRSTSSSSSAESDETQVSANLLALPVPPLEVEFISGPRTGERMTIHDRQCTVGRGEASGIQISDPALANVSRIHCLFEYVGDRWTVRDAGSTNGTWKRVSCVLDPSKPVPLTPGMSVLAGSHEFIVEEADLGTWWPCSKAAALLEDMVKVEAAAA